MLKKILGISIFVLFVVTGTYLYFNFNNIALRTTETIATNALGVDVKIGSLDVALLDKRVTVANIKIANPEGYKGNYIIEIGQIDIGLNSVSSSLIDFKNIDVTEPVINVEINDKGMNVMDLKNQLSSGGNASENSSSGGDAGESIKVTIDSAEIKTTTINASVAFLDKNIASFTMPSMKFTDIGKGENTSAGDAMTQILKKYTAKIQEHVVKNNALSGVDIPGISDVNKVVNDAIGNVTNKLKGLFN